MFIEFTTSRNEIVSININKILYVTATKKGCLLVDCEGMDYSIDEEYTSFMTRLDDKIEKMYKMYNTLIEN